MALRPRAGALKNYFDPTQIFRINDKKLQETMRNLITSHRGTINVCSKEVPDLPLVSAVFDPVGDTMLCTFGPTEDFKQIEIQQLSVCLRLVFTDLLTKCVENWRGSIVRLLAIRL